MRFLAAVAYVASLVFFAASSTASAQADGSIGYDSVSVRHIASNRLTSLRFLNNTLDSVVGIPAPAGLNRTQSTEWKSQTSWLESVKNRYATYAHQLDEMLSGNSAVEQMVGMNMQFDALQQATESESEEFHSISVMLKTRHDTAMTAVHSIE